MKISRQTVLLGIAFMIIFAAFSGSQQFVTVYFAKNNQSVGFISLILVYVFYMLSGSISGIFIKKYGSKKSMQISIFFYSFYIFSLSLKNDAILYFSSILLGVAASLLWNGQEIHIISTSSEKSRGVNLGIFMSIFSFGSAMGIVTIGILSSIIPLQRIFLFASIIPLFSLIIFSKIKNTNDTIAEEKSYSLIKTLKSKTLWQLSPIWLSTFFVFGMSLGEIPLQIKEILGIPFVGFLSSLFFLFPILLSGIIGKLSDRFGRKLFVCISFSLNFCGLLFLIIAPPSFFLILGVVSLALAYTISIPVISAFIGDISTKENLKHIVIFFRISENMAFVSAIIITAIFQKKEVYFFPIILLIISMLIVYTLLSIDNKVIKQKIIEELY